MDMQLALTWQRSVQSYGTVQMVRRLGQNGGHIIDATIEHSDERGTSNGSSLRSCNLQRQGYGASQSVPSPTSTRTATGALCLFPVHAIKGHFPSALDPLSITSALWLVHSPIYLDESITELQDQLQNIDMASNLNRIPRRYFQDDVHASQIGQQQTGHQQEDQGGECIQIGTHIYQFLWFLFQAFKELWHLKQYIPIPVWRAEDERDVDVEMGNTGPDN